MDIKELEKIMTENGLVIRAIPQKTYSVFEPQHINKYPNGIIKRIHGREMLVVEETPKHAGKFMIQRERNCTCSVWFLSDEYFDTIEQAVENFLKNHIKE